MLSLLLLIVVLLFHQTAAFAQAESFGIVQYTPPAGWNKTQTQPNVIAFSIQDKTTGGFGIITVHGATPGSGNATNDFAREWNNLVVQTLKAEVNPQTETKSEDGWTAIAGLAAVDFQGGKALAFLTVFSGFGKTVSVLGVVNDQKLLPQLQAFIEGLKMGKPQVAAPATTQPAPARISQSGESGSFGSMKYSAPAGWSEQKFSDGVVFKPLDLPGTEVLALQIMPPLTSGSLEQALQQSYDEAAAMYKATKMHFAGGADYNKTDAQQSFRGWEYIRGKGGIQVENGTPYKTELGLELFVVKVNNRFERVAILESRPNCKLSRYYSSDRIAYRNGIESLLFSLEFSDFNSAAISKGSAKGAGIVGVWQGISLSVGATSIGEPLGVRYKVFSPIFLNNGQAYFGPKFPTEGLSELDSRIPPELYRRNWGTYTFSNGRGILKMPYANIPLRLEGSRLIITANQTDHAFARLNSVDGATFNGTYALTGQEGVKASISFTSDGRFTDNGAVKVLYHEYVDCLNAALAPGSGSYEVKDYTLLLNYSDGRKIRLAFPGAEYAKGDPSPPVLLLSYNEDKLVRQ